MAATTVVIGRVAPRNASAAMFLRDGANRGMWRQVEPTREPIAQGITPLGMAVREACTAILAGELQPCRWCGSIAPCDCLRWHEYMLMQDPDPHGDLSVFSDEDLRY